MVHIQEVTDSWHQPEYKWAILTLERQNFGDDAYDRDDLWDLLDTSIYITIGWCDVEERPVAYAAVEYNEDGHIYISTIAVEKTYRNQKLGRRMIQDIMDHYPTRPVYLMVREDNAPAIALYKSMGFEMYGVSLQAYHDKTNGLLMKCVSAAEQLGGHTP